MKIILTIILFFNSYSNYGQSYYPLIRPNLVWQSLHGDNSQICSFYGGDSYFFQGGDTTILGFTYKTISINPIIQLNPGPFCPPYAVDGSTIFLDAIFIREDTIAKKVFIYDFATNNDDLFYDFNLVAGDTLKSTFAGQGVELIVDSVSTIALLNGQIRKIFYLNNAEYYIESIGGSQGLHHSMTKGISHWETIYCISENNSILWGGQCLGTVGITESDLNSKVIFPNPFDNILNVDMTVNDSFQIFLYNNLSNEILHKSFRKSISLSTAHIKNGIYFYKIIGKNGSVLNGKLIKK